MGNGAVQTTAVFLQSWVKHSLVKNITTLCLNKSLAAYFKTEKISLADYDFQSFVKITENTKSQYRREHNDIQQE